MTGEETDLFVDRSVRVTTHRIVINSTTYALANVTSVSSYVQPRPLLIVLWSAAGARRRLLHLGRLLKQPGYRIRRAVRCGIFGRDVREVAQVVLGSYRHSRR